MTPSTAHALPVAGAVLHVVTVGPAAARPLLVLHGGPGEAHDCLRPHLDRLAGPSRRVVYYDQRGGGLSPLAPGESPAGWEGHVADVDAVRRHLAVDRVDVLGFSWGALLAVLHARAYPERTARLVLVSPPPLQPEARAIFERNVHVASARPALLALRAQLAQAAGASDEAARRARFTLKIAVGFADPARALDVTPVETRADVAAAVERSLAGLDLQLGGAARCSAPALVLHGADDVVPTAAAAAVAAHVGGALRVFERCGHAPFVEAARPFFAAVEVFLGGGT